MTGEPVAQLVRNRLAASGLSDGAQRFGLAAVAGGSALKQALASGAEPVPDASPENPVLRNVWLRSVTVRGFRGIGRASSLEIEPGPG